MPFAAVNEHEDDRLESVVLMFIGEGRLRPMSVGLPSSPWGSIAVLAVILAWPAPADAVIIEPDNQHRGVELPEV